MKTNWFKISVILLSAIVIAAVFFLSPLLRLRQNLKQAGPKAESQSAILTTEDDWALGSNTATNLTLPAPDGGNVGVSVPAAAQLDIGGMYSSNNSRLTVSDFDSLKLKVFDNDSSSSNYWGGLMSNQAPTYKTITWTLELDDEYTITEFSVIGQTLLGTTYIETSDDGANFTNHGTAPGSYYEGWKTINTASPTKSRYIRIRSYGAGSGGNWQATVNELKVYGYHMPTATHISAPTQITSTNLYQWQTFTPTYTAPANTTISFKFRTSTDASSWTDWTSSQTVSSGSSLDLTSLITSKTGDPGSETFYKYIQVESTLTSSDGVSTPTLSDYTIGYHTNVPPDAPSNLSVVVGE